MTEAAGAFGVLLPALVVVHQVADQWVQTEYQAASKGLPGWRGQRACATHVATYTLSTTVVVLVLWGVFDLGLTVWGVLAGQMVSAVSHYWADRRTTLATLAGAMGHGGFYRFGAPRPGRDDNPCLGTGAYALDQSWHGWWLLMAAFITVLV